MKDKFNQEKRRNWLERLIDRIGKEDSAGHSKHGRGRTKPKGWHRSLRNARKRQRQARKNNR